MSSISPSLVNSWIFRLGLLGLPRPEQEKAMKKLIEKHNRELQDLWSAYNETRQFKKIEQNAKSSMAYFLGFHLNNCQRIGEVLTRSKDRDPAFFDFLDHRRLKILDLGCGCGAFSETFLTTLNSRPDQTSIELIDQNKFHLQLAARGLEWMGYKSVKKLQSRLGDEATLKVVQKIIHQLEPQKDVLIFGLSYVLNEILKDPRSLNTIEETLFQLVSAETPSVVALFEPGRESEARISMEFRQELIDLGFTVIYPCPCSGSCPMGLGQKDWCYSEVYHHKVPLTSAVDQTLKLKRHRLATSAYLFLNPSAMSIRNRDQIQKKASVFVGQPFSQSSKISLICDGKSIARRPGSAEDNLRGELKRSSRPQRSVLSKPGSIKGGSALKK